MNRFIVMTLFPEMVINALSESIIGRAAKAGLVSVEAYDIREYANNKHNSVDDYPYGGGAGMLMQAEPVFACWDAVTNRIENKNARVIFMSPQGKTFTQEIAQELAEEKDLIFLCGHYEGIDQRVLDEIVTDELSLGDFVVTGGELPACVMIDAISRMVPGVLSNAASGVDESFTAGLLEHPQYTRPAVWHDKAVPPVILSGDHAKVEAYRKEEAIRVTKEKRPDLYEAYLRKTEEESMG